MTSLDTDAFAIGRFSKDGGEPFTGIVMGATVIPAHELLDAPPHLCETRALLDRWDANFEMLAVKLGRWKTGASHLSLADLMPHAPLPDARQIFCTGANYRRHVVDMVVALGASPATDGMSDEEKRAWAQDLVARQQESGRPFIFMKPVTTIAGPCDDLVIPAGVTKLDWELELGVVIGRRARSIARGDAEGCIAGYMIVNDVSARDLMARPDAPGLGADWLSSKGAPGFLPCGPLFVPRQFVPDPALLRMRLTVNGVLKQDDDPSDMIYSIPRQIEFLTSRAELLPGDILCTGSPTGNGIIIQQFLAAGDIVEATIDGLGMQRFRCVAQV